MSTNTFLSQRKFRRDTCATNVMASAEQNSPYISQWWPSRRQPPQNAIPTYAPVNYNSQPPLTLFPLLLQPTTSREKTKNLTRDQRNRRRNSTPCQQTRIKASRHICNNLRALSHNINRTNWTIISTLHPRQQVLDAPPQNLQQLHLGGANQKQNRGGNDYGPSTRT